jgi:polyhydroxybutyrate depolymerase
VASVADTINFWVTRDSCPSTPDVTDLGGGVVSEVYTPCAASSEVVLYRIEGGGHTWPGAPDVLPKALVGETNRSINASEVIWSFFARRGRTGADEHG